MTIAKLKLKKGDRVVVLSGKDIGKEGSISRVIPERNMAIVDGINIAKKHQRATSATAQGGIIDKDMPIHLSNLALLPYLFELPPALLWPFRSQDRHCRRRHPLLQEQ